MPDPGGKKGAPVSLPGRPGWSPLYLAAFLVMLYAAGQYLFLRQQPAAAPLEYGVFLDQLEAGNVAEVAIEGFALRGRLAKETPLPLAGRPEPVPVTEFGTRLPTFQGEDLIGALRARKVRIDVRRPEEESFLSRLLVGLLPWAVIMGVWIYVMRRASRNIGGGAGGLFSFGESKARVFAEGTRPKVTFADVAGMDNVKLELREIIAFLKDPRRFADIGARVPKGVLLVGAPGPGKTLLARATAGEAGVPFFSINASEFGEMFVGVGASPVRDQIQPEVRLRQGPDGQYYVDRGIHADYRLLILVMFVVAVIACGLVAQWYLVSRYRLRLESASSHGASLVH